MESDFINNFYRQIDRVDSEILILIKRRFHLAKKIGKYKLDHDMSQEDLNRDSWVLRELSNTAITMQINESFVRKLFQLIIDETSKEQRDFVEKKSKRLNK